MHDPRLIWRLGRWIARRENGAARLAWSGGEIVLRIHNGRIHSVSGIDADRLGERLGADAAGHDDLLDGARALAALPDLTETQALGAAKELIQEALLDWVVDPDRELELVDGEPDEAAGATISVTHAIVELILSDTRRGAADAILPDHGVLLRRTSNFLELYAPLRLSEEADLIVAKITGQRTVDEISDHSPHGAGEVHRLLAALVATGMLEPIPVVAAPAETVLPPDEYEDAVATRRRLPIGWMLAAIAALLIVVAAFTWWWMGRSETQAVAADGATWGVVVDMGCEPQELQRMLRARARNPAAVEVVTTGSDDATEECWRLVWGRFETQADAEAAVGDVPTYLRRDGFEPHAVELSEADLSPDLPSGTD